MLVFRCLPVRIGLSSTLALAIASSVLSGCGRGDAPERGPGAEAAPVAEGVCALLDRTALQTLAPNMGSAGIYESLAGGIELCSWPDASEPSLLLQVGPSSPEGILSAVQLGEGYESFQVTDGEQPMAATVEQGDASLVAVLALDLGERTIVLSPLARPISHESQEFEELKKILIKAGSKI